MSSYMAASKKQEWMPSRNSSPEIRMLLVIELMTFGFNNNNNKTRYFSLCLSLIVVVYNHATSKRKLRRMMPCKFCSLLLLQICSEFARALEML